MGEAWITRRGGSVKKGMTSHVSTIDREKCTFGVNECRLSTGYISLSTTAWSDLIILNVDYVSAAVVDGILALIKVGNDSFFLSAIDEEISSSTYKVRVIKSDDFTYKVQAMAVSSDISTQSQGILDVYGTYDGSEIE